VGVEQSAGQLGILAGIPGKRLEQQVRRCQMEVGLMETADLQ